MYLCLSFSFLIWAAGSASAALASLLVDSPEPQSIGKHYLLAPLHLLSSDSFSSLICSLLLKWRQWLGGTQGGGSLNKEVEWRQWISGTQGGKFK